MWGSKRRSAADISRWRANGWLTPEGEAHIVRELARSGREVGLASALGILASVLLGVATMSFVAAHWAELPRIARLSLLFGLMFGGYATAGFLSQRPVNPTQARVSTSAFADAAILFAVSTFGASIMLISQMFHIEGHAPDGIALWGAGALLSGVVLRSSPALALAMILAVLWWAMELSERSNVIHWPFLVGWAAVTAAFAWHRWTPGAHLSAIAISAFVVSLGYIVSNGHAHDLVVAIGLSALGLAALVGRALPAVRNIASIAITYALATVFAGLMALQFIESPSHAMLIFLAAATLAMLVAAIAYAMSERRTGLMWLGYIGFSIEVLALYAKTIGTLFGTSLFFLAAGLLVAALAAVAWYLAKRSNPDDPRYDLPSNAEVMR